MDTEGNCRFFFFFFFWGGGGGGGGGGGAAKATLPPSKIIGGCPQPLSVQILNWYFCDLVFTVSHGY